MFFSFRFSQSALSVILAVSLCAVAAAKKPAPKATAMASDAIAADRMAQYADLAEQWEREYLQINTNNPPGNEARAAEYKEVGQSCRALVSGRKNGKARELADEFGRQQRRFREIKGMTPTEFRRDALAPSASGRSASNQNPDIGQSG